MATDPSRITNGATELLAGIAERGQPTKASLTTSQPAGSSSPHATVNPHEVISRQLIAEGLSRIPPRFLHAEPLPQVRDWLHAIKTAWTNQRNTQGCPSIILLGPTGTGKTEQFWVSYRDLLTPANAPIVQQSRMINMVEVFTELRPSSSTDSDRLMHTLKTCPILWADDLASAPLSEFERRELYRIIDYRYQWMLPVMVSSNLPAQKDPSKPEIITFADAVGDRIASRLRGMGQLVPLTGKDRRG